jgi:tetratricopeptide (TPR) repeat protein
LHGSLVGDFFPTRLVLAETVFKLFVSSPGDVAAERARAEAVVEKLNAEFKDRARFDAVFWEDHYYSAHETIQDQIPEAADCDLVLAIFRARLGSPLPAEFKRQPDGAPYPSGSAYEVLSAVAKRHGGAPLPDIYVFRYPRDPVVSLDDPQKAEIEEQWTALKDFFARWFKTPSGQFVAGFQSYDSPDEFAEQVEACLRQWLAKRGIVAREIWDRARFGSPFPGLAAFDEKREHVFFGRDLAIRQASERLRAAKTSFLLILGASGAGKSSLLRAGLMPKLTLPGAIPEVDLLRPVVMTPGLDPFAELAEALLARQALGGELAGGRFAAASALTEALRGDPKTAAGVIGEALDKAAEARRVAAHFNTPRPARLLLAVDQAERLFTEAAKDADAFGRLLQALAGPAAHVVMVMRSDAYARFQASAPLLALRTAGATLDFMPPTAAELEEIVARPVAVCEPPLLFGPSHPPLAECLAKDAKGGDALPLLQMTLDGLYKAQETRADGVLRAEDYNGMAEAVTEAANAAMKPLGESGRKALEELVAGLVADLAPDPVTGEPAPVVVALDRDAFVKGRPERAALIDAFVEARLLTLEGGARVRPTHEALLRIWPEAAALLKEMAALIRARHALLPLAQQWAEAEEDDKPGHLLIPAPLLRSAQLLEENFGEDLGKPLRPFIAEALKADPSQILARDALTPLAQAWAEAPPDDRAKHLQISAPLLAAGQQLLARFGDDLGAPLRPFIAEAVEAEAAERAKKTRARRVISGATLAALVVMTALAGAAIWQWREAATQRAVAERNLALATDAANLLVFDLAQKFRNVSGVPASLIKSLLDRAGDLQEKLLAGGQTSPKLRRSQAAALDEKSETLLTVGDTTGSLEAAQSAASILSTLLAQAPNNADYLRELSVTDHKIGNAKTAQGDLAGALKAYQDSLAIRDRLAKSDPGNAQWQRDLSVVLNNVGDVKTAQGDIAGALKAYQDSLAIANRLAKSDPGNAQWQRDLSVVLNNVGDVKTAQGDLAGAEGLSRQPRHRRPAGDIRFRQRPMAARSLGVV